MAEKRMFAKTIVLSDEFLDMPLGARCLYMTMNMMADDDGFVNNAKSTIRMVGATEDDLKVLVAKRFIIPFEDGVIVIRHWRINNILRNDRYHETKYLEHKAMLLINDKGEYELNEDVGIPSIGIPSIGNPRLDLDKVSIDKEYKEEDISIDKNINIDLYTSIQTTESNQPTDDEMVEAIINSWNQRKCILAPIDRIVFQQKRWNDTFICISQFGYENFLYQIDTLDSNERFKTWKPSYDWFCDPNNFIKVYEGNFKTNLAKPEVDKHSKEYWDSL